MKKVVAILLLITHLGCSNQTSNTVNNADIRDTAEMKRMILEEAKPEYIKAYVEVNDLKSKISLADSGLLSKKQVLNYYNQGLGQTIGRMNSFDEMKIRIDTSGEAYIKMRWYNEAARIASKKAGNANFEAELLKTSNK